MSKILTVDDNNDILTILRATFESAGHEVVATTDPFDALRLVERHQPDAAVLDVMMPGLSGWDVLRQIRERPETSALPVVLLSALNEVGDKLKGLRGGADDYQTKPFDSEEILARLEGLIGRYRVETPEAGPATLRETILEIGRRLETGETVADLRLGRYELKEVLGIGEESAVLEGWDPKLERTIALKILPLGSPGDPGRDSDEAPPCLEEAALCTRIRHPNLVTVFDAGEEEEAVFIAMELVRGTCLRSYLKRCGRLAYPLLVPLAAAVSRAINAAHQGGILHLDLKPENVLLGADGSVKVSDFGVAGLRSRKRSASSDKPVYAAPECRNGEPATAKSDLFSLGATLYECASGAPPYRGGAYRESRPIPIEERVEDVSPVFAALVTQMLELEPEKRPSSSRFVAELFEEMAAFESFSWQAESLSIH